LSPLLLGTTWMGLSVSTSFPCCPHPSSWWVAIAGGLSTAYS